MNVAPHASAPVSEIVLLAARLADLPPAPTLDQLRDLADATGSADLARLARQYLPFTFSRRHGDPSRPWNRFAIRAARWASTRSPTPRARRAWRTWGPMGGCCSMPPARWST